MSGALDAALALMPAWIPWATLALVPLSALLTWLLMAPLPWLLGGAVSPQLEWPEDARQGFERRRAALLCAFGVSFSFGLTATFFSGPLSAVSGWGLAVLCGVASWLATLPTVARVTRMATGWELSLRAQLRGSLSMSLVRTGHLLILLALSTLAPTVLGPPHLGLMGLYLGVAWAWYGGLGLRLARGLGWAREADARVQGLAASAAARAEVALQGVYFLEVMGANALALPNTRELMVTGPAARLLSDAELEAILEHEVGHLVEAPGARRLRMAVGMAYAPLVLGRPLFELYGGFALLGLLLYLFAVVHLGRRLSLRLEHAADAHAHEADSATYARALEALYRYNGVPPVLGHKTSHPDLYDRLVAAGVTPDYPRPEPPSQRRSKVLFFTLLLLVMCGGVGLNVLLRRATFPANSPAFLLGALHGGDEVFLLDYADTVEITENRITLIRGAVAASGGQGWVRLELLEALLEAGQCAEAQSTWDALIDDGWRPEPWDAEYAEELEARLPECQLGAAKPGPGR